jgi:transcriptional regulator with XRE-family HTH domain
MEERLIQLFKAEGINPTRFAERIGVQRSSISHILSGRNKPSFDFIIKILDSFPAINPDWLLRGKGLMYKNDIPVQPGLFDKLNPVDEQINEATSESPANSAIDNIRNPLNTIKPPVESNLQSDIKIRETQTHKRVEKVVILYEDRTFSYYFPE